MKNVTQIIVGIIIAAVIIKAGEMAITYYRLQQAADVLTEINKPRFETRTVTIEPQSKETCIRKSKGIYNETYLTCRQGIRMQVQTDLKSGNVKILESEPILKDVNVL